jgi:hypothetical protein
VNAGFIKTPLTSSLRVQTTNVLNSATVLVDQTNQSATFQPSQGLTTGNLNTIAFIKSAALNKVGDPTAWNISFNTATAIPAGGQVVLTFSPKSIYTISGLNISIIDQTFTSQNYQLEFYNGTMISKITVNGVCGTLGCGRNFAIVL